MSGRVNPTAEVSGPSQQSPGQPEESTKELVPSAQFSNSPQQLVRLASQEETSFFERNFEQRPEIIGGILREGQLAAFAGPYGVGKSPALADITIHVINGIPWCGLEIQRRPVIHVDFESPGPTYRRTLKSIALRLGVPLPKVPSELDPYLELDDVKEHGTGTLLHFLKSRTVKDRLKLIDQALALSPNALVIVDPLELLLPIDTGKKLQVLWAYGEIRQLLSNYPHAAMIVTFNLRKEDMHRPKADLLTNPRSWLNEVCGTLDLLNRSDVRLAIDFCQDDIRVVNGIRRSEEMYPLLIRPVENSLGELAGFELCATSESTLTKTLTPQQLEYWRKLPPTFRFEEIAGRTVPRSSLSRLLARAKSLGLAQQKNGIWELRQDPLELAAPPPAPVQASGR